MQQYMLIMSSIEEYQQNRFYAPNEKVVTSFKTHQVAGTSNTDWEEHEMKDGSKWFSVKQSVDNLFCNELTTNFKRNNK